MDNSGEPPTWAHLQPMTCGQRWPQPSAPSWPRRRGTPGSRGCTPLDLSDDTLILGVPSSVTIERLRTSYLGLLTDAAQALTGVPLDISLLVDTTPRREEPVSLDQFKPGPSAAVSSDDLGRVARSRRRLRLAHNFVEPPLHLRPVRHRCRRTDSRTPPRSRSPRAPARSYNPLFIYGAGRTGQDPPPPRDRPLRPRALSDISRSLRLDRDADERVRRRDPLEAHARASNGATARSTCCSSTTSSSWSARSSSRRSSSTRSTTSTSRGSQIVISSDRPPEVDRHHRGPAPQPVRVGPHHRHPAPEFETRLAILQKKAESEHLDGSPIVCSDSSPKTSSTTSASSRAP